VEGFADVVDRLWGLTGAIGWAGDRPNGLTITGPRVVWPSAFDVTGLATGAVAVATLATAGLLAARRGSAAPAVTVDARAAGGAFAAEALFTPVGWELPPLWDPIAGNYRADDGWIRLHTNYGHHRVAVERVLGAHDREAVQAVVGRRPADEVESAVVAAGGAAAVMHERGQWLASAPGAASAGAPPVAVTERQASAPVGWASPDARPFAGVRVLDLTRVIAGPMATKFLAAYGADVLRVDPPGFAEVDSLLPETTVGKRTAFLDLSAPAGRATFDELLAGADVLVSGLRADALDRLGYDDERLAAINPDLTQASLDAYGWNGPWRDRRGFDSLVQMSCGIAAQGAAAGDRDEPVPLPVQALDHATGWLLAAAIARALTRRLTHSRSARIHASLIGTANLLYSLEPVQERVAAPHLGRFPREGTTTAWGPARRVPLPGRIDGSPPVWSVQAGPLGRHSARWDVR
jgi:hypothetical protein